MADEHEPRKVLPLKTLEDISDAYDFVFNKQIAGELDAKTVDSMNTTLKGASYIKGKLRMDYLKLYVQASIKKISLPPGVLVLPDLSIDNGRPDHKKK